MTTVTLSGSMRAPTFFMKKSLPKIIAIVGPTASGKSDLAVAVARKFNGEVISADSRQVYKDLDIGTGKITKREMKGVPHHLLDVCSPKKVFTVALYKKLADKAIADIISRGKIPIICGGTGFYVDTVTKNLTIPEVPPNQQLRKRLEKQGAPKLFAMLQKLDPRRACEIDRNNKVRLIRAIEIAKALGKVPTPDVERLGKYETLYIGTLIAPEVLKERIHKRLIQRIKMGMVAEAKRLHNPPTSRCLSWKRMYALGLEYRYLALYLQGKISKNEMILRLNFAISHYAKRQMTWFKRNKDIVWIDPRKIRRVISVIQKFLK